MARPFAMLTGAVDQAVAATRATPLRVALSALSVLVGVAVMVAVASVAHGYRQAVVRQVRSLGTDNLYAFRFPLVPDGPMTPELLRRRPLELADARAVARECSAVRAASAALELPPGQVRARWRGREYPAPRVRGVQAAEAEVYRQPLAEGRWFTAEEARQRREVCVLADGIAAELFGAAPAAGAQIELGGHRLTVVGVLESVGAGPLGGASTEDAVVRVPYGLFRTRFAVDPDHFIAAVAWPGRVAEAEGQVRELLRRRRGLRPDAPDDFWLGKADALIASLDEISFGILLAMAGVSVVAFVVGGVGIANIMLVTVTERTREIGLRKALGAQGGDIALQFFAEAALVTGAGGVLGVLGAELLLPAADAVLQGLPAETTWGIRLGGMGAAVLVGLVAGTWPALHAARLAPAAALARL